MRGWLLTAQPGNQVEVTVAESLKGPQAKAAEICRTSDNPPIACPASLRQEWPPVAASDLLQSPAVEKHKLKGENRC